MPREVFLDVLLLIDRELLAILQQEGGTEPLQHQLNIFVHEVTYYLEVLTQKLRQLEIAIDAINPKALTHKDIEEVHHQINIFAKSITDTITQISSALALAWNSNREDLIDALSFQKECWQKYDTLVIGTPRFETGPASGLYARLEDRLNTIFCNPEDPNDMEALHDDEPAIEALVKFSIWYLHDYWEIGLLPKIKSAKELDLDQKKHSDRERSDYRGALFSEAQKNLEQFGLKTVRDLKDSQIFSREMLQEFINQNN